MSFVVSQAARPFVSKLEGKMSYEDFVWFILSEEDKSNELSLEYWFRCVDLDCDGKLRPNEMLVSSASMCGIKCVHLQSVLYQQCIVMHTYEQTEHCKGAMMCR